FSGSIFPTPCGPGPTTGTLRCPIRTGNTAACNGGKANSALVVGDDGPTSGWDQDIVTMCCGPGADGGLPPPGQTRGGGHPKLPDGQDCPTGHICSECGDSGIGMTGRPNLCKACFTIPYTAPNCSLSTEEEPGGEVAVCTHSCPAGKAVLAMGTPGWF